MSKTSRLPRLKELGRLFFKLGVIGFGGPAAHIALMEEEVVVRRGWTTRQHFLDLIGATNLIPGPNSTEMTMHVGYLRAGWPGLVVAGASFIFPAAFSTLILAWAYVRFGTLPEAEPFLIGINAAVLAVIASALWRLGKKAISGPSLALLAAAVGAVLLIGMSEISALLAGGLVGGLVLVLLKKTTKTDDTSLLKPPSSKWFGVLGFFPPSLLAMGIGSAVSKWKLGLFFLKVGAVLYGSGYVLIAFLEGDLVDGNGWLTQQQLLDAVAIGQFTPGPVLTTATFIGYVLAGVPGAIIATLGIFLPAFVLTGILHPFVPRLRSSKWTAAFLDAINASSVALMAVVTLTLAHSVFTGPLPIIIFLGASVLSIRFQVSPAWLVIGGAAAGALGIIAS